MDRFFLLIVLSLLLTSCAHARQSFGNVSIDKIVSVYDADTFKAKISKWPDVFGENISIRVMGVDAPEIHGKCQSEKDTAQKAKRFTQNFLQSAKRIELRNIKRGKYFRILAAVYADGKSLASALIKAGLARPYHGGSRQSWCDK